MATKSELQSILKEKYGINKNISHALDKEQCERLIFVLEREPSTAKLVESFAEKNASLGQENKSLGSRRYQAEIQLQALKAEYAQLTTSTRTSEIQISEREKRLEQDKKDLEARIQRLMAENEKLTKANDELKKDNKALKNLVDQIKLRTVIELKQFLNLEDSEIRQALMKWFKRTIE